MTLGLLSKASNPPINGTKNSLKSGNVSRRYIYLVPRGGQDAVSQICYYLSFIISKVKICLYILYYICSCSWLR